MKRLKKSWFPLTFPNTPAAPWPTAAGSRARKERPSGLTRCRRSSCLELLPDELALVALEREPWPIDRVPLKQGLT